MIEIKINKDREYSFLILFFFIVAFIVFVYWSQESFRGGERVTGMVTSDLTPNASVYLKDSLIGGTFTLNLKDGDAIPDGVSVSVKLLGEGDSVIDSWSGSTLSAFIALSGETYTPTTESVQFVDMDTPEISPAPWEACSEVALKPTGAKTYTFNLKDFDLKTNTAGFYNVTINATYTCNSVGSAVFGKRFQVQIRNENAPTFGTALFFTTLDGKSRFKMNNEINCSAKIIDVDKDNQTVNYKIWGPTGSYTSPTYSGPITCDSIDFSTGKYCSVIQNITGLTVVSKGVWNCSLSTNDGFGGITEINLTGNLTMINSEPYIKLNIPNQNITGNKTDLLDLDDYLADYNVEDTLTFNFTGNSSLLFVVGSDNTLDVNVKGSFRGSENISIFFRDGTNTTRSNWFTILVGAGSNATTNCTSNWTCGAWSDCLSGIKTRTCTDSNSCATSRIENQTCAAGAVCGNSVCESTSGETCSSCSIDCGACQQQASSNTGVGAGNLDAGSETSKTSKLMLTGIILGGLIAFVLVILLINYFLNREKRPVINVEESGEKKEVTVKIEKETKQILPEDKKFEKGNVSAVNVSELRDYINKSLANKIPVATIKEELLKTGWKENQITKEFDILNLESYIKSKVKQGIKKEDIIEMLKTKGWTQEQIDEAFKNAE